MLYVNGNRDTDRLPLCLWEVLRKSILEKCLRCRNRGRSSGSQEKEALACGEGEVGLPAILSAHSSMVESREALLNPKAKPIETLGVDEVRAAGASICRCISEF